ncbi:hypothetical protein [Flavobacterium sp. 5]|uniref:hypothetical protein n=1 Tax=Flavobacterium sp. 5 TaxID=2035199 RepID=UPI000C2B5BB8|nr:hypothetical protein [Flavobacterium sp. 5]PKB15799.1 hypothetical protein CLU82_0898 [Flavobacterium sp. 5]
MKKIFLLPLSFLTISCQVTETIHLNADGSGTIEIVGLREENSYMILARENYSKENVYRDTSYVFGDYIKKHHETFSRTPLADQNIFLKYSQVKIHKKESSYEKEFRTTITQNFQKASAIVDLYKTEEYANDIKNNYALTAEEHYYKVCYDYNENRFNRIVTISDTLEQQKQIEKIEKFKAKNKGYKLVQKYVLNYYFPRKIQSFSNSLAEISSDKKSLKLELPLLESLQNPIITNLEVVLEPETIN